MASNKTKTSEAQHNKQNSGYINSSLEAYYKEKNKAPQVTPVERGVTKGTPGKLQSNVEQTFDRAKFDDDSFYAPKVLPSVNKVQVAEKNAQTAQSAFDSYKNSSEHYIAMRNTGWDDKYMSLQNDLDSANFALKKAKDEQAVGNYASMANGFKNNKAVFSKVDKIRAEKLSVGYRAKEGDIAWQSDKYNAMTDDEVELYNRLAKNGKEKEADEFLSLLDSYLDQRVTQNRLNAAKERAKTLPITASAGSVLLNTFGGLTAAAKTAYDAITGKELNPYDPAYMATRLSGAYRGAVAENIAAGTYASVLPGAGTASKAQESGALIKTQKELDQNNRDIAAFLYQSGMSIADMIAATRFGAVGAQVIMASNAGATSMLEAQERGASDSQAITIGVLSGFAEAFFEKFSIDNLLSGKVSSNAIMAALKQGGIEASEEIATEAFNFLADGIVMQNKSEFEQSRAAYMAEYMQQGMSEQEASKKANTQAAKDFGISMLLAGASGFLSGAAMGAGADIINAKSTGNEVIDKYTESILADGALEQSFINGGMSEQDAKVSARIEAQKQALDMARSEMQRMGAMTKEGTASRELADRNSVPDKMSVYDIGRQYAANAGSGMVLSSGKAKFTKEGLKNVVPATADESKNLDITDPRNMARYIKELDDAIAKKLKPSDLVTIGLTPNSLSPYMDPTKPIKITQKVIEKITDIRVPDSNKHVHGLDRIVLDELPYQLADPLAITKNTTDHETKGHNSIIVWTDWKTQTGDAVIVPIRIDIIGEREAYHNINSVFNVYDDTYKGDLLREGNVLYTRDNKNIQELFRQQREVLKQGQELNVSGNNISDSGKNVNTQNNENSANDHIGGSDPVPQDVKDSLTTRKKLGRAHESLKNRMKRSELLDTATMQKIDTFAVQDIPIGEILTVLKDKNPETVIEYYRSFMKVHDAEKVAINYRKQVLNRRHSIIRDELWDKLNLLKDKGTGFQYMRNTQERNIRDISKNAPEVAQFVNDNIFEPVHINEAKKTRWMQKYADRISGHKMSKAENAFVHMLITERDLNERIKEAYGKEKTAVESGMEHLVRKKTELLAKEPKIDLERCNKIADDVLSVYREIYGYLTDTQIKNGMPVTEFRSTYAPMVKDKHGNPILDYFGIELDNQELPTSISGLTEFFRPGKPWFSHDLQRTGYKTEFDILTGLDEYLKSAGDVIFHTDDIQNVRMFESVIRERTTSEGQAEAIKHWMDQGLVGDELYAKISEQNVDASHLSNYVKNLQEYGNLLANKKSSLDRGVERIIGRNIYRTMNNIRSQITGGVLNWNISVALSQAIPLTQAVANVNAVNLAKGFKEAAVSYVTENEGDNFDSRSTFITNRRGYERVGKKSAVQKMSEAKANPMNFVDSVVSSAITRGRYYDNIDSGMNSTQALEEADRFAASLIADRSKGALPTLFESKNPISTLLTMFQVESNNQIDFIVKDMRAEATAKTETKAEAGAAYALALAKMFIAAFAYNELRKKLGLTPNALDPFGMARDTADALKKYNEGDATLWETFETVKEILTDQIPFFGSGRYGTVYENALPDFKNLIGALENVKEDGTGKEYLKQTALEELSKPVLYLGLPTAGGQIKKTVQGLATVAKGGSYKYNKEDELRMQYPVAKTLPNVIGGALFGKSGLKENKDWKAQGFPTLSPQASGAYQKYKEAGGTIDAFTDYSRQYDELSVQIAKDNKAITDLKHEIENANPIYTDAEALAIAEQQLGLRTRNAIDEWIAMLAESPTLTDSQKMAMIGAADIDKQTYAEIQGLVNNGVSIGKYLEYSALVNDMAEEYGSSSDGLTSAGKKAMELRIVDDNTLTEDQKVMLSRKLIDQNYTYDYSSRAATELLTNYGTTTYKAYKKANESSGISADCYKTFIDKEKAGGFKGTDSEGNSVSYLKRVRLVNYIEGLNESEAVKKVLWEEIYDPQNECKYEKRFKGLVQRDGIWVTPKTYMH